MNVAAGERLAFFVPSLRGGGAERVMLTLAEGFAAAGHPVDLVLARAVGPLCEQVPASIRTVDLGCDRVLATLPKLVGYLRRERPGAMLAAMSHTNVVAVWARWLARVPVRIVISEHNTLQKPERNRKGGKHRLLLPLMRRFYPLADDIVAVSGGVAGELADALRLAPARVRVVYNPVVKPDIETLAASPVAHRWLAGGGPPVVVAAGRLTAQKDYPTLLRAFAAVAAQRPARLLILGEGEERPRLEALIRELRLTDCVDLPGFTDNPYACMARAALFVSSSAWEGFGNVLVEALALGIPVVATDCRFGPSEILDSGKYGRLVPVGDADALAAAILASLATAADARRSLLRERAARFTLQHSLAAYRPLLLPAAGGSAP